MSTKTDKTKIISLREAVKQGKTEIIVREGSAKEIREKKIISISGTITCPRLFWENRHDEHSHHKADKANVVFSKDNLNIVLSLNENSHWSKVLTGSLQTNKELDLFSINANKTWAIKELSDFLKARKFFFKDRSEATRIIANLQKFSATITTELQKEDNRRGDTIDLVATKVKSNIDLGFTMKLPIFKGEKDQEFKVEIEINSSGGNISVYLVSEDLYVMKLETIEKIFTRELKPFLDAKIVVIEK